MRQVILSDFHSVENFEIVYTYLNDILSKRTQIDSICVNGDLLGIFNQNDGYIHGKSGQLPKDERKSQFKRIAPNALKLFTKASKGQCDTSEAIYEYVRERYEWAYKALERLSGVSKTYFNLGNHESPLHFLVLSEIGYLLGVETGNIWAKIDKAKLEIIFNEFREKLKALEAKGNFAYISLNLVREDNRLFVGIPGINHNAYGEDEYSQIQENATIQFCEQIQAALEADPSIEELHIYYHVNGEMSFQGPFTYKPASPALNELIDSLKGKLKVKTFTQSHHHYNTTYYFTSRDVHFILNNSAVNHGLFNMLAVENGEVFCLDVDPRNDKIHKLLLYNLDEKQPATKEDRVRFNYPDADKILKQRVTGEFDVFKVGNKLKNIKV